MTIAATKGNSSKNSTYLAMMQRRTIDPTHPRNMGVRMQAHQVLSATGVTISKLGKKLVKFGYDINTERNLVFIPSTLQDTCYLGVQPHRGNHLAKERREVKASDTNYDDDAEPRPYRYHEQISDALEAEAKKLPTTCKKGTKGNNAVTDQLDALALVLLVRIQRNPSELPVTSVAAHFNRGSTVGCGGHDSVPTLEGNPATCDAKRKHHKDQKKGQREEKIGMSAMGNMN